MPILNSKLFDKWKKYSFNNESKLSVYNETLVLNTNCLIDEHNLILNFTNSTANYIQKTEIYLDYQVKELNFKWIYVLVVFLIILGIVGNCLVCLAIYLEKRLQNPTNYFLLSLAVADLLVSLIVMPFLMLFDLYGYWPLGTGLCNFWVTCDVLLCSSSIIHMCFISIGRYIGIRHPLTARHVPLLASRKAAMLKILIAWLIAAFITSPISIAGLINTKNIQPEEQVCAINNRLFFILGSIVSFFLPMLIMVNTYILTIRLLKQKAKLCQENSFLQHNVNVSSRSCIRCKEHQSKVYRRTNSINSLSSTYSTAPIFSGCLTSPHFSEIQTVETQFTCTVQRPHLKTQLTYSKNYSSNITTNNLNNFSSVLQAIYNWTSSTNLNSNQHCLENYQNQNIKKSISFTFPSISNYKKQSASLKTNINLNAFNKIQKVNTITSNFTTTTTTITTISTNTTTAITTTTNTTAKKINFNFQTNSSHKNHKLFCCSMQFLHNFIKNYNKTKHKKKKINKRIKKKFKINCDQKNESYQLNTVNCLSCSLSKKKISLPKSKQFSSLDNIKLKNDQIKNKSSKKHVINIVQKASIFDINFAEPASTSKVNNDKKKLVTCTIHHNETDIKSSNKKFYSPVTSNSFCSSATFVNNLHCPNQSLNKNFELRKKSINIHVPSNLNLINSNFNAANINNLNSSNLKPVLVRTLGSNQVLTEQKATKVLGIVFFVFIVCWVPFFTHNFLLGVWPDLVNKLPSSVAKTLQWLGYVSSTLNPIIYTFFNRNFRRAFRCIITCQTISNTRYKLVKSSPRLNTSTKIPDFHNSSVYEIENCNNKFRLNRNKTILTDKQ